MENMIVIVCLSLIGLVITPAWCAAEPEWQLYRDQEGIQLYSRPLPNSDFLEFKAVTIMETEIEAVGIVLRDVSAYPQWMPGCKRIDVVERFDENNMIVHYVRKMPWPLTDRDLVLNVRTQINWEVGAFTVQMSPIDDPRIRPQAGLTRMKNMVGQWLVKYVDREHTRVTYIFRADPALALPASIINNDMQDFPYQTLRGMQAILREPRYIEAERASQDREVLERYISEDRFHP
jgi:hypothetical protein